MSEATLKNRETESTQVVIDRAKPEDAKAIMTIKRNAWLSAYPNEEQGITIDDINQKFLESTLPQAIENWRLGITNESQHGDRATFVARLEGNVAGVVSPLTEGDRREITTLYVAPEHQGRGIGAKLLSRALEWHEDNDVYLFVVTYNQRAIGLYESFGFQKTGVEHLETYNDAEGYKHLPEIEMMRPKA